MKYKDGAVEKKTMVDTEEGKVEKIQRYTESDIANGIASCERLLATGSLDEGNTKAVQAELDWWIECKGLIPDPVVEEVFRPLEEIDEEIDKEIYKEVKKEV